jgi:hypothetical protein
MSESSPLAEVAIADTDPSRTLAGHYSDLNYVPWYAAPFAARMQYLYSRCVKPR